MKYGAAVWSVGDQKWRNCGSSSDDTSFTTVIAEALTSYPDRIIRIVGDTEDHGGQWIAMFNGNQTVFFNHEILKT